MDNVNYDLVSHNELGDIIHRCKDLLSTRNGYAVRHVRRQASRVAITRASLSNHSPCIFNDVPDYLYSKKKTEHSVILHSYYKSLPSLSLHLKNH